ncbi:MAG: hypothetical protein Q9209_002313 [Squamulea sp. 1 TL-2023]
MVKTYDHLVTLVPLLLATILVYVGAQATTGASRDIFSSSLPTLSVCLATSVNHIIQSLPQQCFTTTWVEKREGQTVTEGGIQNARNPTSASAANTNIAASASFTNHDHPSPITTSEAVHQQEPETHIAKTSNYDPRPTMQETLENSLDGESESPLDNAHFLSFEEWKKRNLAKAGQSLDNVGGARSGTAEPRRRPGGMNNALDFLGEDTEIEIDFAGFVNPQVSAPGVQVSEQRVPNGKAGSHDKDDKKASGARLPSAHPKSKDAGVTCKERSNYASFDCAATMLKTNPECKSATSVLVENKDSYMLNECSAKNKFFIVELCNDILVDTVVLANFEFFSSIFRTFRVSVSDRYPVKLDEWRELGTFEAKNSRVIQAFLIKEPQIWARYLRIEFLTHYGHEYYCPVSLLRVHGTTMMEEFNHELKNSKGEEDVEGEVVDEQVPQEAHSIRGIVTAEALKQKTIMPAHQSASINVSPADPSAASISIKVENQTRVQPKQDYKAVSSVDNSPSAQLKAVFLLAGNQKQTCRSDETPAEDSKLFPAASLSISTPITENPSTSVTTSSAIVTAFGPASSASANSHTPEIASSAIAESGIAQSKAEDDTFVSIKTPNQASQSSSRTYPSSTQPSIPNPTTQESFFKSVHKRLQLLESNSTLSLQYIEDQSRILRDAFAKVEKRQLAKTTTFLEALNTTVLNEIRDFRSQYDQIWQSTVLELSSQRQQSQSEIAALSTRLTLLADELLFQKRIAILQFLLILLCLGLALFSRGSAAAAGVTYLEHVVNKSSINLSRYASGLESQPGSPSSTRPPSRYGFFSRARSWDHRRSPSEESMGTPGGGGRDETKSPSIEFEPATPISMRSEDEGESPRSGGSPDISGGGVRDLNEANGLLSPDDRPESSSSSGTSHTNEASLGGS